MGVWVLPTPEVPHAVGEEEWQRAVAEGKWVLAVREDRCDMLPANGLLLADEIAALRQEYVALGDYCILAGYRGSVAHGTFCPDTSDDVDIMAVCVPPLDHYFGLRQFGKRGTHEYSGPLADGCALDLVAYEARKFVSLLAQGNPNVLCMLWLRPEHYLVLTPAGRLVVDSRDAFAAKSAHNAFVGYARAQLERMTRDPYGSADSTRRKLVEKYGYDVKAAAHAFRLLEMGCEFLETGVLNVWREDAAMLLAVKRGEWRLAEVQARAALLFRRAEKALAASSLPDAVDMGRVNGLCVAVVETALAERREV